MAKRTKTKLQPSPADRFVVDLLAWFDRHGRKDLPWQHNRTAYRVWVSEIMLQQTRVSSVIEYYQRFMGRFPDLQALANAPIDEVLHLWSGLGYYARARNLHKAAQVVRDQYGGVFPTDFDEVAALPGIGASTAGAILALSADQRHPILDGNVKRVLSRYHGVEGWSGRTDVSRTLWDFADQHTPTERVSAYTQAIMDLGAMICTRSKPACAICPVQSDCYALSAGRTGELPTPKPRKELPVRQTRMLMMVNDSGEVLLEQRPPTGIWGGLWGFPECATDVDAVDWCREHLHCQGEVIESWSSMRHTFSHFHLDIFPLLVRVKSVGSAIMEAGRYVWYNCTMQNERGLAAPVQRLLNMLSTDYEEKT